MPVVPIMREEQRRQEDVDMTLTDRGSAYGHLPPK